jgi:hypothetical protein
VSYAISRMIIDFVYMVVCSTFGFEVKGLFCVVSKLQNVGAGMQGTVKYDERMSSISVVGCKS